MRENDGTRGLRSKVRG